MSGVSKVFIGLEEAVERYSSNCINEANEPIRTPECVDLLAHLQKKILPKINNMSPEGKK